MFYFSLADKIKLGQAMNTPVSVIVCVHDEEQNLRELIPLLLNQNHSEFEIIIVNDRSNDGTYDFLLEATKKDSRLKAVHVNHKPEHVNGKKYALTLGIRAAKFDWVLLTDADCRPANEWARQMAGGFSESTDIVIGYSPYKQREGFLNSFIRFETIITAIQYFSFALMGMPYMGVGRNLAYRKKIFLENKGFGEHMNITGGDDDLFVGQHANAKNVFVVLNEKATVISEPKATWKEFFTQKIRHLSVGKHFQSKHSVKLVLFTTSWVMLGIMAFPALIFGSYQIWILSLWIARLIVMILTLNTFNNKSGEKFDLAWLPVLDFIFGFYYLVAGFKALFAKRIAWKI